jgi:hypothetical protein
LRALFNDIQPRISRRELFQFGGASFLLLFIPKFLRPYFLPKPKLRIGWIVYETKGFGVINEYALSKIKVS